MKTKTVRIAVAVGSDGAWESSGWGYDSGHETDAEILSVLETGEVLDGHQPAHVLWVRAEVFVPEASESEVPGVVEP